MWRPIALTVLVLLYFAIADAAQTDQGQTPRRFTGPCSQTDSSFSDIANATGGQVFLLRGAEMNHAGAIMEARLGHGEAILTASGRLAEAGWLDFPIPVDSTIKKASITVSLECKGAVRVLRPSGAEAAPADADITSRELVSGRVVSIRAPEPGTWRVQAFGLGRYSVAAQADSPLRLLEFDFVRVGGRPGHEGLFPIRSQPIAGEPQTGLARLDGPFGKPTFKLISQSGATLKALSLAPAMGSNDQFLGAIDLPTEAFRLAVEGTDERGLRYQRVYGPLYRAQTIQVWAGPVPETMPPGAVTTLSFHVRNFGPPGGFRITFADSHGALRGADAPVAVMNTGDTVSIEVDFHVPITARGSVTVTAVAASTTDAQVSNSAMVELAVSREAGR